MARRKQRSSSESVPQQRDDSQSEFSVNESLKQAAADDRKKEQHDAGKEPRPQQGVQEEGFSSESEFSVSQRREEE